MYRLAVLYDDSLERFERRVRIRRRMMWLGSAGLRIGSVAAVSYSCRSSMRERPAGFIDAVTSLDHAALRDAPPCPRQPPGGARAYTVDEVAVAPTRAPRHRSEVIVIGQHQQAMAFSPTRFHRGHVLGVAYLWDDDAGAITCAGEVKTSSSDVIDYTERGVDPGAKQRAAEADLQAELDRVVTSNLHQVLR